MAITAKELIGSKEPDNARYDLDTIRKNAKIPIRLPEDNANPDKLDAFEVFDVNGKTLQIKKGEPVTVNWYVFETLENSGRNTAEQILR